MLEREQSIFGMGIEKVMLNALWSYSFVDTGAFKQKDNKTEWGGAYCFYFCFPANLTMTARLSKASV